MKLVCPAGDFCSSLARQLGCDHVEMERRIFPDGEVNPRIEEAPREVILVNRLVWSDFDVNRYLLEYIFAIKNLREQGTEKISVVMPYLPYSRQDSIFRKGESFTSKYVLEIFRDLEIEDIFAVTFHLHRKGTELVKGVSLHDIPGIDALAYYFKGRVRHPLCVAPDGEAEKWAQRMAEILGGDTACFIKRRDVTTGKINVRGEIPEGRNVIIVDDMISTGETVLEALKICREFNPESVVICAVHGIFSRPVTWDVDVVTTNTVENPYCKVDVTPFAADVIKEFCRTRP